MDRSPQIHATVIRKPLGEQRIEPFSRLGVCDHELLRLRA
jgi:hypothetical protein